MHKNLVEWKVCKFIYSTAYDVSAISSGPEPYQMTVPFFSKLQIFSWAKLLTPFISDGSH